MRYIMKNFGLLMAQEGGHVYFRPIAADVAQKYITTCPMLTQGLCDTYVAARANESLGAHFVDYCVQTVRLQPGDDFLVPLILDNGELQWYHGKYDSRFSA